MEKINQSELPQGYSLFGGRGDVFSGTAHIYKDHHGCLCGKPALSTNWVRIEEVKEAGCEKCIEIFEEMRDAL